MTTRQTTQAAIIWLLASSVFINYIDRTNLAIAGPLVSSELHLTGSQFGLLSTAFFVTYAQAQVKAGKSVDEAAAGFNTPEQFKGYEAPAERVKSDIQVIYHELGK